MRRVITILLAAAMGLGATAVEAAVLRVPGSADTVQGAVAIANPGDTIEVGAGRWCGALITKRLDLVGRDDAVIVGVKDGKSCGGSDTTISGTFRVGFYLRRDPVSGTDPSGTTIRHFRFDGSAIASDPSALAVAVYADPTLGKVDDVVIEKNKVVGTFHAFKNEGGDRWVIRKNHVRGLTARNGVGGAGIVITQNGSLRPRGNSVTDNHVRGRAPSVLSSGQWFTGVTVAGAIDTTVSDNHVRVAAPAGQATPLGVGVLVTSGPGSTGQRPPPGRGLPGAGTLIVTNGAGSENTVVTKNDGDHSDFVVVVAGTGGTNTSGLVLKANRGAVQLEGQLVESGHARDRVARAARKGHDDEDDD